MLNVVPSHAVCARAERPHREQADAGSGPQHVAPRGDRAGHAGAVRMRPLVVGRGIETGGDRAGEIGMRSIDLGIDHRDQDAVALCQAMRLGQIELLRRILIAVQRCRLFLRQRIEIIRLHTRDQTLGADIADHVLHRTAAIEAPAMQSAPGEAECRGLHARHGVTRRNRFERLLRRGRRHVENDFGRKEARLADRRQVAGGPQRLHAVAAFGRCLGRSLGRWRRQIARKLDLRERDLVSRQLGQRRRAGRRTGRRRIREQVGRDEPSDEGRNDAAEDVPADVLAV